MTSELTSVVAAIAVPTAGELAAFGPELLAVATIFAILVAGLFLPKRSLVTPLVTVSGGLAAAFLAAFNVPSFAGSMFSGLLVVDGLSGFLRMLIYAFLALIAMMWLVTAARRPGDESAENPPEFFVLLISAAIGMGFMVSTGNLLMVVVGIELASLASYGLAGFGKFHRRGAEAALKYVVFGAASAAVMIYGVSLLYGCFGTLDAGQIGGQLAVVGRVPVAAAIGLVCLLAGVGFKIAAVPFHFWCPDVFEGASVEVAAFLSVASKAAGLALLIRLGHAFGGTMALAAGHFNRPEIAIRASNIALTIGIVAALTATVGNLAALAQDNLKRLLAYSSIAHAGYMLMAGAILTGSSGAVAVLLYLVVYLFMNLGAFSVVAIVYNHTGSEQMRAFSGLGRRAPLLAVSMALFMVSLVGLPPLAGFAAKYQLFYALFVYGGGELRWLVVVALVNTLISLFFYMRVVKAMFLESGPPDAPSLNPLPVSRLSNAWVVALAAPVTLLLIVWQPLTRAAEYFSMLRLFSP